MGQADTAPAGERATRQVAEIYEAFAYFIKVMQARGDLRNGGDDGVTGQQSRTLQALKDGPHSMGVLSERLYVHPSTASGMIDRLLAKGLVARRRSTTDRRRVEVSLTPAGERFVAQASPSVVQVALDRLRAMPSEELATVHGTLQRLRELFAEVAGNGDAGAATGGAAS